MSSRSIASKEPKRTLRDRLFRSSDIQSGPRGSSSSSSMGNAACIEATEDEKPSLLVAVADDVSSPSMQSKSLSLRSPRSSGPTRFIVSVAARIGAVIDHLLFVSQETSEPLPVERKRTIPGGVLLEGCKTPEEYFERHDGILAAIKDLKGEEGLRAAGFSMRIVPCAKHAALSNCQAERKQGQRSKSLSPTTVEEPPECDDSSISDIDTQLPQSNYVDPSTTPETGVGTKPKRCPECVTRLFYNDTVMDHCNRRRYVSDGIMYDEVARLCMEYAHDIMIAEGDLEWKTIDADSGIHALVSKNMDLTRPTLLLVTGRGKVRAGIFTRKHIQTTGLEPSTAIDIVREAKQRNMNVVMLDPNCRGEREAYRVVETSMSALFSHVEQPCDNDDNLQRYPIFVQAHSAAGSHVVCYLLNRCDLYVPHIQAIAFTDSTHNIQWTRKEQYKALNSLLESSSAVYFRSSKGDTADVAGTEITRCDAEWKHRFGNIRTYWAGTTEHSLSDWSAREFIWRHFDEFMSL